MDKSIPISGGSISSSAKGRCPRCGDGALFSGFLDLAKKCNSCGLDYDFADSADGPAVFVILIAGFLIVAMALMVEIFYRPPYWVHAVLWLPIGIIVPVAMLRPLKGMLIALQYRNSAKEAQFDKDGTEL